MRILIKILGTTTIVAISTYTYFQFYQARSLPTERDQDEQMSSDTNFDLFASSNGKWIGGSSLFFDGTTYKIYRYSSLWNGNQGATIRPDSNQNAQFLVAQNQKGLLWYFPLAVDNSQFTIFMSNGRLGVVGGYQSRLYILDPATGKLEQRVSLSALDTKNECPTSLELGGFEIQPLTYDSSICSVDLSFDNISMAKPVDAGNAIFLIAEKNRQIRNQLHLERRVFVARYDIASTSDFWLKNEHDAQVQWPGHARGFDWVTEIPINQPNDFGFGYADLVTNPETDFVILVDFPPEPTSQARQVFKFKKSLYIIVLNKRDGSIKSESLIDGIPFEFIDNIQANSENGISIKFLDDSVKHIRW